MNVLEVIDHKSLGGDDLSTHYAGENGPQPGHCHYGPGHRLAMRILSSESVCNAMPFPESLPMRQIILQCQGEWELCKWMRMYVVNRPGVAGAVLQSPPSLTDYLSECTLWKYLLYIFNKPSFPNGKS